LATREGEKAKVSTEGKTGYFSQAVRSALEQAPSEMFPPDMKAIAEAVKQHFASLDKKQLPTYLYYRSWDGDEEQYHLNPFGIPHNIPKSDVKKFVGRQEELQKLYQLLQENDVVAITDITGEGGVGKTELAKQYAWKNLANYVGGCCWLNAQGQGIDLKAQLVDFGLVNFPNFNPPPGLSIAGQIQYCWKHWLSGKVLLVFDNVKDWTEVQPYIPPQGSDFKVLITTRQKKELLLTYPSLELGGLKIDEALKLLTNLWGKEQVEAELDLAKTICLKVNCIPIGLYLIQRAFSLTNPRRLVC